MNYCSHCGSAVRLSVPAGDNRERHVCETCGTVHYQNPRIIAGCLPVWEDKVLLCRRAIEPRLGFWTLPAGYMELGETLEQAARRETWEEACAEVTLDSLYLVFALPNVGQVHMHYLARLPEPRFAPGSESLETSLFAENEIPWDQLAFETVRRTLVYYFADRPTGTFPSRVEDIYRKPRS